MTSLHHFEPSSYAPLARLDSHGAIVKEPEPEETDPVKIEMERRHQEAVALLKRQQEEAYRKAGVEPPKPKEPKICEVYYFHNDASGLPEELSNDRGQLVWRATYKTWGSTRAEGWGYATLSGEQVYDQDKGAIPDEPIREQNLRFQGQYLDRGTGLHYNTFRYYDPDIGRFISPDPIGLAGGINLGSYAPNPMQWVDPWGWASRPAQGDYTDMPGIKDYQKHHNIPLELQNHPAITSSGYDLNNSRNITYLPENGSVDPSRTVHRGKHNAAYTNEIGERLTEINATKASPAIKRLQIQALSDDLGNQLRSKKIRLNKAC